VLKSPPIANLPNVTCNFKRQINIDKKEKNRAYHFDNYNCWTNYSSEVFHGKNNIQSIWYQTNESYDPITNTWSTYSNLPSGRWAGAAAVLNNEIHYLGGSNGNPIPNYNNHFVYNSSTDSWSNALSMLHDKETP
jgi:hypothetical protein